MNAKILITGATGNNGAQVVKLLSEKGIASRAMARHLDKVNPLPHVEWVQGDFADVQSLIGAMQGIEKAFIVTPVDQQHVQWHKNFYAAAKTAGVKHVIKFSGFGASTQSASEIIRMHGETDALLKVSGLIYTIIQPNSFFQNIMASIASIKAQHSFYLPLKNAKQSLIDIRDITDVIYKVLTTNGHENKVYQLTGQTALNYYEVADQLSQSLGQEIHYVDVPPEAAKQSMQEAGMPEWQAGALAEILSVFAQGQYQKTTSDVELITGHKPRTFEQFVEEHRSYFV